jgi:hypothetical protein
MRTAASSLRGANRFAPALSRRSPIARGSATILLAVASVVALDAGAGWYRADSALRESGAPLVGTALEPKSTLLKDDNALIKVLQSGQCSGKDAGILASQSRRDRRDGVAKNADARQRLDQPAEDDTAIVSLIEAKAPQAKTPAVTAEADKAQEHACAWRDRSPRRVPVTRCAQWCTCRFGAVLASSRLHWSSKYFRPRFHTRQITQSANNTSSDPTMNTTRPYPPLRTRDGTANHGLSLKDPYTTTHTKR